MKTIKYLKTKTNQPRNPFGWIVAQMEDFDEEILIMKTNKNANAWACFELGWMSVDIQLQEASVSVH